MHFEGSLYSLDSSPFDRYMTCTLPPLSSCLFILLTERMFLILMKSRLSIFPVMHCGFGVKSENSLPNARFWRFSIFFSKSFVVLWFVFGLWFTLSKLLCNIWGLGQGSLFCLRLSSFSSTICCKSSFLHWTAKHLCQKSVGRIYVGLFLGYLFCSTASCFCLS